MLTATGLVKHYGGVAALDDAGITAESGQVHALVGENGAGKSTLVKIISGAVRPDAGSVELDGHPVRFANTRQASAHGIAIVSQELMTFGDLTVLENLFPFGGPRRFGLVSTRAMERRAAPVLEELGLDVSPHARVETLSLADRQLLEICRALLQDPRVLILDEPTSALPRQAADRLAGTTKRLAERGLAVLYISHFLEEVLRVAQRVTVLRDGRTVLTGEEIEQVGVDSLVTAMLGGAAPSVARAERARRGAASLALTAVGVAGRLRDVSLNASGGEIVGLAGLQGAGHLAVLDVVCGRARPATGSVRLPGGAAPRSPRHAVAAGVAYVSGDRKGRGLMLDQSLWENATAVRRLGLGRDGLMPSRRRMVERTEHLIRRLRIRGGPYDVTAQLSGGNQQKAVLAKWLDADPAVFALDDPTRGVDVGARAEMHEIVRDLANDGKIVLIAATDLTELVDLCDRVLVFQRGRITDEIDGQSLSEQALSLAMNAGFAAPL
ncbi:sugar ABC transporter ATP-binding protein [Actinoallomurus bryophytorum]|uniref:Ribose transport system ATP-binding protein n=1 Tax=Actinoallomurus bryophytorum TaxID=1490222 RepID=A0A543CQK2_9ACTN|nr:sugar ABC transporter ATP-binding protein [Actinoallomurus bryophytorum]TQL99383.1 ribose transport system ATP-binding protein [Actinoallomurus bryophytorum]